MFGPLQIATPELPAWARLLSQVINLATAIVGLVIAYIAYQGYRRNDSRPMFYIAVGFVLAIGLPFLLLVPSVLLSRFESVALVFTFVRDLGTLVGLLAILYALRMPT